MRKNLLKILFIAFLFYCKFKKSTENGYKAKINKIKPQSQKEKSNTQSQSTDKSQFTDKSQSTNKSEASIFNEIKGKIKKQEDKNDIYYLFDKINSQTELNNIKSEYGINDSKSNIVDIWEKLNKKEKVHTFNKIPIEELFPMKTKSIKTKLKSEDDDKNIYKYRNKFLCKLLNDYKLTNTIEFLLSSKVYKQQDISGFRLFKKNDYELWNKSNKEKKLQKEYEIKHKNQRFAENAFFCFKPNKNDTSTMKIFKILKIFTYKNRGVSPIIILFRKIDEPEYYIFYSSSRLIPKKGKGKMPDYIIDKNYKELHEHFDGDLNKNIDSHTKAKNIEIKIDKKNIKVNDHFYTEYVKGKVEILFDIIKKDLDTFLEFKKRNNKEGTYLNKDKKKVSINIYGYSLGSVRAQLAGLELLRLLKDQKNKKYFDIINLRIIPFASTRAMNKNGYKALYENNIEITRIFNGKKQGSKIIIDPVPSADIAGLDECPIRYLLTNEEIYVIPPNIKLKVPSMAGLAQVFN